jgi:malonyl CoA-acyl carrier protein transacylase
MKPARDEFFAFLKGFSFSPLTIPVIANISARPYGSADIAGMLSEQITGSVLWYESIRYLIHLDPNMAFREVESAILTKMVARIRSVQGTLGAAFPAHMEGAGPSD